MSYHCIQQQERLLSEEQLKKLLEGKVSAHMLHRILIQSTAMEALLEILEAEGAEHVVHLLKLTKENQERIAREQKQREQESQNQNADSCPAEKQSETTCDSDISENPENPKPAVKDPKEKKGTKKRGKKKKEHHKRKGHGRHGAEDFKNARQNFFPIGGGLCSGGVCPCGQGKLYSIASGKTFRYEAAPLLETQLYAAEKLRCNGCFNVFAAHLPAKVTQEQPLSRATPEAAATSLLTRYGLGFPDLRLETLQQYQGHPLPNSTQWDISLEAFLRLRPFFKSLLNLSANAVSIRCDDAHANVISLKKQINIEIERAVDDGIEPKNVRSGIHNTWVVAALHDGHEIHLSLTGREHQGEVCYEMLLQRTTQEPLVITTDAAAKATTLGPLPKVNVQGFIPVRNAKKSLQSESQTELLMPQIIHSFCLQHLRLHFQTVEKNHQQAVAHVLQKIAVVFSNERQANEKELTPPQRLEFHQNHSQTVMDTLHLWLKEQFEQKIVEPNSDLGKAISYALNQWTGFTEFLRSENIPLDTNACERDVYFTILHRNNSIHYQTVNGATVGDAFMGLIATCREADVNPLNYISALLSFSSDANHCSEKWLPWNYKARYLELHTEQELRWSEIDAVNAAKGYRQCVRTRSVDDPPESPPPHRFRKKVDLKTLRNSTANTQP
jgi:transposase